MAIIGAIHPIASSWAKVCCLGATDKWPLNSENFASRSDDRLRLIRRMRTTATCDSAEAKATSS